MTQDTNTAGNNIDATLAERGSRYGSWREQSRVTQNIKAAMQVGANWDKLPDYMRESLEQIANKFARVLSGDWTHLDNWHDTVGYAKLAEECLMQDIAGNITPPVIFDPDNPPVDLMIKLLSIRGYVINPPDTEKDEYPTRSVGEVRQPSYDRDPLRTNLAGDTSGAEDQS